MLSHLKSDTNCLDAFESLEMTCRKNALTVCLVSPKQTVHLLMGERRGLNPRVVDSQSTALIHLATSAPTPAQVEVSIYDQILSELPRLSKRSFFRHYSGESIVVFRN